ncbi:hypothetical protein J1N35_041790, partial [Gossypium stocksii]
ASDKQDEESSLEESKEDCIELESDEALENEMSECRKNMKFIKNTAEVEKEVLNTILEHEMLRINFQHQMEVGKSSEDVHTIEEICDCVKVIMEEPSHFLRILEKVLYHEPIKDNPLQGDIQWKEEN